MFRNTHKIPTDCLVLIGTKLFNESLLSRNQRIREKEWEKGEERMNNLYRRRLPKEIKVFMRFYNWNPIFGVYSLENRKTSCAIWWFPAKSVFSFINQTLINITNIQYFNNYFVAFVICYNELFMGLIMLSLAQLFSLFCWLFYLFLQCNCENCDCIYLCA